jgi:hypothetical protein
MNKIILIFSCVIYIACFISGSPLRFDCASTAIDSLNCDLNATAEPSVVENSAPEAQPIEFDFILNATQRLVTSSVTPFYELRSLEQSNISQQDLANQVMECQILVANFNSLQNDTAWMVMIDIIESSLNATNKPILYTLQPEEPPNTMLNDANHIFSFGGYKSNENQSCAVSKLNMQPVSAVNQSTVEISIPADQFDMQKSFQIEAKEIEYSQDVTVPDQFYLKCVQLYDLFNITSCENRATVCASLFAVKKCQDALLPYKQSAESMQNSLATIQPHRPQPNQTIGNSNFVMVTDPLPSTDSV